MQRREKFPAALERCAGEKVAVMAATFAKRDMDVDACHVFRNGFSVPVAVFIATATAFSPLPGQVPVCFSRAFPAVVAIRGIAFAGKNLLLRGGIRAQDPVSHVRDAVTGCPPAGLRLGRFPTGGRFGLESGSKPQPGMAPLPSFKDSELCTSHAINSS